MENVHDRLTKYRHNKLRKGKITEIKGNLHRYKENIKDFMNFHVLYNISNDHEDSVDDSLNNKKYDENIDSSNEENIRNEGNDVEIISDINNKVINWSLMFLKFILWFIVWKIFILFGFGAVYFVFSCFVLLWFSMYSGKRRDGPSAYSVFNENCEQIAGTYSAEKIERELLYR